MPTVVKSIGTIGRDYSSISLWEADLDSGALYASGDTALGECYNDTAFDEAVTINGGGTVGLAARTLQAASGQGHTGIAGTGVRIVRSVDSASLITAAIGTTVVKQIELSMNAKRVNLYFCKCSGAVTGVSFRQMICHDAISGTNSQTGYGQAAAGGASNDLLDSIIYNIENTSSNNSVGAEINAGSSETSKVCNCTFYNFLTGTGTATYGVLIGDNSGKTLKNVIACNGETADYSDSSITVAAASNNISSDTTSSGTGSIDSVAAANLFVSVVAGSEDLHLKAGALAIDAGTDLVTTPTGVNFDIDNRDRDALGDVWDIGADEFVAAAGAGPKGWFGLALYGPMQRAVYR